MKLLGRHPPRQRPLPPKICREGRNILPFPLWWLIWGLTFDNCTGSPPVRNLTSNMSFANPPVLPFQLNLLVNRAVNPPAITPLFGNGPFVITVQQPCPNAIVQLDLTRPTGELVGTQYLDIRAFTY